MWVMWEQDPEPLLASAGLLPLATLAKTNSPQTLLERVALQVSMIEEIAIKQSISACTQLLAGLVFEPEQIHQLFRRQEMRESVIYQEILREGIEQGIEQGRQEALNLLLRQLNRRFGTISIELQTQIQALSFAQLQNLGEALFDFSNEADLATWLNQLGC